MHGFRRAAPICLTGIMVKADRAFVTPITTRKGLACHHALSGNAAPGQGWALVIRQGWR